MEKSLLQIFGEVAGIGGLCLGIGLIVFRDVIRKVVFRTLPPEHAFHIIKIILYLTFTLALGGLVVFLFSKKLDIEASQQRKAELSPNSPINGISSKPNQIPAPEVKAKVLPTFEVTKLSGTISFKNTGGEYFNELIESVSTLSYGVPQYDKDEKLYYWILRKQVAPYRLIRQSRRVFNDADFSYQIEGSLFQRIAKLFCDSEHATNLNSHFSNLAVTTDVLFKYDDENGQQHRRSWLISFRKSCDKVNSPVEIDVRQANATSFPSQEHIAECLGQTNAKFSNKLAEIEDDDIKNVLDHLFAPRGGNCGGNIANF